MLSEDDIRIAVEEMDSRGPELGAQVVARAWVDPPKQSLLQDAPAAVKALGIDIGPLLLLVVVGEGNGYFNSWDPARRTSRD